MREQWSVLKLQVRRKMPKALLVILFTVVVGSLGYWLLGFRHNDAAEMQKYLEEVASREYTEDTLAKARSFANGGSSLYIGIMCIIGFLGMMWACIDFPSKKSKSVYTLRRLRTSETAVLVWDAVINAALFLVLWVCAIALIFLAGRIYESGAGFVEGPQGITAAIGRDAFYRGIVPVVYPWIALRNVVAAVCCGLLCAGASYRLQNRSTPFGEILGIGIILIAIPFRFDIYLDAMQGVYWKLLFGWIFRVLLVFGLCLLTFTDSRRRKEK